MKWNYFYVFLLISWNILGTIVTGKRGQKDRLTAHRISLKKLLGNGNLKRASSEPRKIASSNKITGATKVDSGFTNKRSFVGLSTPRKVSTNTVQNPEQENESNWKANNGGGAAVEYDTSDLEFVDGANGNDDEIEITNGPEKEQENTKHFDSRASMGEHSKEENGRRQQIENVFSDFDSPESNQVEHEQNSEENTDEENQPNKNGMDTEYRYFDQDASKPVEYATSLASDNQLNQFTKEAKSDYQGAERSMTEGTKKDTALFENEVDDVLGALEKSDSTFSDKVGGQPDQAENTPNITFPSSPTSDKSADTTTNDESSNNDVTPVLENVTETMSHKAEKSLPLGISDKVLDSVVSSEKNYTQQIFEPGVKGVLESGLHSTLTLMTSHQVTKANSSKQDEGMLSYQQMSNEGVSTERKKNVPGINSDLSNGHKTATSFTNVETTKKVHVSGNGLSDTATADSETQTADDETDVEEVDDENKKMDDGDVSLIDQKQFNQQHTGLKNAAHTTSANNGGGAYLANEPNQSNVTVTQGLRTTSTVHRNSNQTGFTGMQVKLGKNIKWNLHDLPQNAGSEADQQLTEMPTITNHWVNEANGVKHDKKPLKIHQLQSKFSPANQGLQSLVQGNNGSDSSLAKVLSKINLQVAEMQKNRSESNEEKDGRSFNLNKTSNRPLNSLFTNQRLANLVGTKRSDSLPSSSESPGRLTHRILLDYFRNESALQEILKNKKTSNGTEHLVTNFNLTTNATSSNTTETSTYLDNFIKLLSIAYSKMTCCSVAGATEQQNQSKDEVGLQSGFKEVTNLDHQDILGRINKSQLVQPSAESVAQRQKQKPLVNSTPIPESTRTSRGNKKQSLVSQVSNNETLGKVLEPSKNNTALPASTSSLNTSNNEVQQQKIITENNTLPVSRQIEIHKSTAANSASDFVASQGDSSKNRNPGALMYMKDLKSLEIVLSRDFMSDWMYAHKSFQGLGISPEMLRSGVASLGVSKRLVRVFKKALRGSDVKLLIVGGSISAGGGLERDRKNLEGVYYKSFVNWWQRSITPITASKLKVNAVAIGGTDSEYYSYCIKNYMDQLPDIVMWELAANDYRRYEGKEFNPAKPLEQLTRIILSLPSHPALIFLNFFRGDYYKTTVGNDCPDSEDEGGQVIAELYGIPSLSWRNVICSEMGQKDAVLAGLSINSLFSSDGYHPSILGHAQMASLLITYMKGVFEKTISQEREESRSSFRDDGENHDAFSLPLPMYNDPLHPNPMCWTLLTPNYNSKPRNTLPEMEFIAADGFQFTNISHWPIRVDRLRCLRAIAKGATLKMKFFVPPGQTPNQPNGLNLSGARELAITSHNSFGGSARIWLDENQDEAQVITEKSGQRRTQVDIMKSRVQPGLHTLTVQELQLGFCLSAVAVL